MMETFQNQRPVPGYAPYHARLGLSVATLAAGLYPEAANRALGRSAEEALKSADGYAAREIVSYTSTVLALEVRDRKALIDLRSSSGLGMGLLPQPLLDSLLVSIELSATVLEAAIRR